MAFEPPPTVNVVTEMLSNLKADCPDYNASSQIAKFYENKSVFVTGATGFIGKALVEKLVRSCKNLKRIYVLIREKRGKSCQDRLRDLTQAHIFNKLRANQSGMKLLQDKLRVIKGDITLPKFGVDPEDLEELSEEVSIVFNSAATIRFVEPIDVAVRNNICSVNELIDFCNQLRNLKALVHLSTAYSNCHKRDTIYEVFYEPPMRGDQIIEATQVLKKVSTEIHTYPHKKPDSHDDISDMKQNGYSTEAASADFNEIERDSCEQQVFFDGKPKPNPESLLEEFTKISLQCSNRPNTYTFTKAISESHLHDLVLARKDRYCYDRIPVAIVRPSIVGGAWREPDVGGVDNFNGPTGAILSLYTGALQAMPGVGQRVADMVPVDMAVNMAICSAWFLLSKNEAAVKQNLRQIKPDQGVYIFNFVSGYRNPLRWHQVTDLIRELSYKYPSKYLVRLPGSYFIRAGHFYNIYDWLNHKMPAMLGDFIRAKVIRQEVTPKTSAMVAYKRIRQMTETLTPFTSNQWRLCDDNVCALYNRLSATDKQVFQFDVAKIDWTQYIKNYIIGARLYTLKDEAKNVPTALRALKMRQTINRGGLTLLMLVLYLLFFRQSELELALVDFAWRFVGLEMIES